MTKIKSVYSRQIFDSRGNPTIEVDVITSNNILGRASVPSGASTGYYEAVEKRDGGKFMRGKGVKTCVGLINNEISNIIKNISVFNQNKLDNIMINYDNTANKSRLGANTILAVSLAIARAAALENKEYIFEYLNEEKNNYILPIPLINVINGGVHSNVGISFQEFMIVPIKSKTFFNAIEMGVNVFMSLKEELIKMNKLILVGDEGGFAPNLTNESILDLIMLSIHNAGYSPGDDIMIAIDCAASEYYDAKNNLYDYSNSIDYKIGKLNFYEQANYLKYLVDKYPIISIEDGMDQNDWNGWNYMNKYLGHRIYLVGDDLLVTNKLRLEKAISQKSCNSILIKYNQIGTLTETFDVINIAKKNNYNFILSHRSGETEDNFISDLSVATGSGLIKTGSVCRTDRVCKYNQLLRIEEYLINNHINYTLGNQNFFYNKNS